ncbi:MAG: TIR domain-containing protein [Candidatus Cryptobacteroides sp.]
MDKEIWIFLSHSNKDFAKVREIRNYLEERSCRPLMFYLKCLSNDDEINALIKREIDCRTRFIICDSANSQSSKWVQSEVKYIKSQQRSYETIDLRKSDEEIKAQLDKMIKNTRIFLSYSRQDSDLVSAVYSHICKYDIRCFLDEENLIASGTSFSDQMTNAINLAKEFGFIVFFASKYSLSSNWVVSEIQYSLTIGAKMLILLLDNYAKMHYKELFPQAQDVPIDDLIDSDQTSIKVRDLTNVQTKDELIESAIEKIVIRAFGPWTPYTMAKNMLEGIDCPVDEDEANRLFRISYRMNSALDMIGYPGGTLFVARCMANGYGTKKDLNGALDYYQDYIRICGSNENIDREIEAVKKELK